VKRLLVGASKLMAACSGPALILYAINLFEGSFALGKQSRDQVHTVLVNNHGEYRYITESQNQAFRYFLAAGVLLLLGLFVSIIVTKVKQARARN
jgi:hypothetical protein